MSKVIVYSTSWCHWCHKLKEWLAEKKVKYEDKNVEVDEEAREEMVRKSGQMGVPVVDVDGKIIVGFDEEELKRLLKL